MTHNPDQQHRHTIRLHDYDYTYAGAYYVTICTVQKQCTFGEVVDGQVRLNEYGKVVEGEWAQSAAVRPYVALDAFVVMPNHVHGVIFIVYEEGDGRGTARRAPTGLHNPYAPTRHSAKQFRVPYPPLSAHSNLLYRAA